MKSLKGSVVMRSLPGEKHTPFGLACKLEAKVILESSSLSRGRERYSVLLVEEAFRIVQERDQVMLISAKERRPVGGLAEDILDVISEIAERNAGTEYEFPFPAGGIGFLAFEFAAYCDKMGFPFREDPLNLPMAAFIFGHVYVIFDHYTDRIHLIGVNYGEDGDISLEKALDRTEAKIGDMNFNYMMEHSESYPAIIASTKEESEAYKSAVSDVRQEIIKGMLLQAVPSRRLEIATEMPAIDAYRVLRGSNPSPYQFYLDFGSYQLFGASPEVHVKVVNGRVFLRPIAGTRRRGLNEAEDRALAAELLSDEKERAEHMMLVDLGRNDLGRVCKVGSVEVSELMTIEKYSKVMHIVSQVEGDLAAGKCAADVIRATFPAGTVSGAPKIQAVKTVAGIEKMPRSFYAGLVGYLEPGGSLDTCITIRSALKKENRLFLQAGGGIVYDSSPDRELEETNEKLRALAMSAGVEL
ncbi:MAG: anthranilate synthase component I [spirochete symbiont of Stewartia floridana]|nr:MAG: anthranilate synthase component I [spirochete symbiont of Stewartia floridana]